MSDSAETPAPSAAASKDVKGSKASKSPAIVGAVGLLLVLAAAGTVAMKSNLGFDGIAAGQTTVTSVNPHDLDAAAGTLTQSVAGGLVDDAKRCRVPLVSMTIDKGTARVGSTIRIRSGSYVSPWFTVTAGTERIAIPYPAPYGSGAGRFVVEGNATGAILGLTPTKVLLDLPTAESIPVVWRPKTPC
jgi:hypothetical protein